MLQKLVYVAGPYRSKTERGVSIFTRESGWQPLADWPLVANQFDTVCYASNKKPALAVEVELVDRLASIRWI